MHRGLGPFETPNLFSKVRFFDGVPYYELHEKTQRIFLMARCDWVENIASNYSDGTNTVALIIKGGSLLSVGVNNKDKTHTSYWNGKHDHGLHAEFAALRKVRHHDNATMYVIRFLKNGDLGVSKPCELCQEVINKSNIRAVHYIGHDGEWKKMA